MSGEMTELAVSMEEYRGYIKSIRRTFDNGDVVAVAEIESRAGMVPMVVVGSFKSFVREGDWFVATGYSKERKFQNKSETQFQARSIRADLPRTKAGALALLDKTFKEQEHGIDLSARHRFVEKHGADTAFKVEKDPELLLEMSKDPSRYGRAIRNTWAQRLYNLQPIRIMESAQAKPDVVNAILKKYKDQTLDVIKKDPFELMTTKGVDFALADRLAARVGIAKNDQRRVSAAVIQLVQSSLDSGNTYIPITVPEIKASLQPFDVEWNDFKLLAAEVMKEDVAKRLGVTIFESRVGKVIQKIETYRDERDIAMSVARLVERGGSLDHAEIDTVAKRVLAQDKYSFLSEEQRDAVMNSSREAIAILTGGPGTGKSTVSEAISEIAAQTIKGPLYLVAPTGKAARRLAEATGRTADTVHKLLGAMGETGMFKFGKHNTLEKGCFVLVDEASMLDTKMTKALLDALPPDGRILFVGDKDQLPSVDAGYVIGDMLQAVAANGNTVPSSNLTEVFRSKGSQNLLAPYAKEIKEGVFDVSKVNTATIWTEGVAFFDVPTDGILKQVEHVYCELVEKHLKLSKDDAVVLSPMRKRRGGTHEINRRLQARSNPAGAAIDGWKRPAGADPDEPTPRIGDRVMMTANDQDLNIRNGDVGTIRRMAKVTDNNRTVDAIEIELESGDVVRIPVSMAPYNTVVAYAITGHKSQGSQYKCVIMPVSEDHVDMLERTLLYTEWTRAKRFVVLVGNKSVFTTGMENTASSKRMTLLKSHIEDELQKLGPRARKRPSMAASLDRTTAARAFSRPDFSRPDFSRPVFQTPVQPAPAEKASAPAAVSMQRSNPFSVPIKR